MITGEVISFAGSIIMLISFYEVGKDLIKAGKELENELSEESNQY